MKSITIQSLTLINFKGIRNLTITDFGKETNIFGANGTGKTSIFDAFTWLLFGKDSQGRTQFEVKTLDKDNNVIPKIEHEVSATLTVDGETIDIKRVLKEKWVTKRGSTDTLFSGNETVFFWNEVPMLSKDFTAKVSGIINESIFKLITNPLAFNEMKWQDQRQALVTITGGVTDEEIAANSEDFKALLDKLTNKSLDEYRKQVAANRLKAKKEIEVLPTRIDEVERGKPEAQDFEAIRKELAVKEGELSKVDESITDRMKAQQAILDKRAETKQLIQKKDFEISDIKHGFRTNAKDQIRQMTSGTIDIDALVNNKESEITELQRKIRLNQSTLASKYQEQKSLSDVKATLVKKWKDKNAEEFIMDDGDCACPTCKRDFDPTKLEEMKAQALANFKANRTASLNQINLEGGNNKRNLEAISEDIEGLESFKKSSESKLETLSSELDDLKKQQEHPQEAIPTEEEIYNEMLSEDKYIPNLEAEIDELNELLNKEEAVNVDDLKEKKEDIKTEVSNLKTSLLAETAIANADKRIAELLEEEKTLAQTIAEYEGEHFIIESFVKARIDRLESLINDKFSYVTFKMFETQINGGEVETCKALINGVPFSDANTASKINAGVDIINTLSNYYGIHAPIFIDNRESVTEVIPTQSQIINLIVSKPDKTLRVESSEVGRLETV